MGLLGRLLGRDDERAPLRPLYAWVVQTAREPHWYLEGAVPDTLDGRFDMVAAVLSVALLRLEREPGTDVASARLTELFVEDMDGQLRQLGIGDIVVGKHIGKMMGALGGRLGAYRDVSAPEALNEAIRRNIYRGAPADPASEAHVAQEMTALTDRLANTRIDAVLAGDIA